MNRQDKEQYLREYEVLKKKGKPFFPYAIMKDSVMAVVVVAVIIVMSLVLGAEQGPKADPTTTTYVPRPEWYFFFLLPFYDRNPERNPLKRPIATTAGILTIASMAFLTFLGAEAGSPTEIEIEVAKEYEAGKLVAAESGCLACHVFEHNGNNGPGPELTAIGARLNPAAISRSLEVGPGIMPSYTGLKESDPEKFNDLVLFLGSLTGEEEGDAATGLAGGEGVEGGATEDTTGASGDSGETGATGEGSEAGASESQQESSPGSGSDGSSAGG